MAASGGRQRLADAVKQVTNSNFADALKQLRAHVDQADFVAVSCRKTGDCASASSRHPWRRVLPMDTPEIAYLKAKLAAESYEILQFAVCPFSLKGSKVIAFPFNFNLFPRDRLNLGMPSYSFSCQTSFLTSMAHEGFDFNACIYDGISYSSRVQESMDKERNRSPHIQTPNSCSTTSVVDSIFMSRTKSRIELWLSTSKNSNSKTDDGELLMSLRKLILGTDLYGTRPSMRIDVCSDRQVQLVLQTISRISDHIVPLVIPDKSGQPRAVHVVLTSSEEDKSILMSEIQILEDEHNLKVRGFREVIDVISSSNKPIIGYNCLHDFTSIHSKFVAPLPLTFSEFMCSLRLVFTNILDINHLSKEIGALRKAKSLPYALSYLKRQFSVPIDIELPAEDEGCTTKAHGNNVLRITHLFAILCTLLKLFPNGIVEEQYIKAIEDYLNILYPSHTTIQESDEEDPSFTKENVRATNTNDLVFLWGYGHLTAKELKHSLREAHDVFKEDFELRFMDKSCAVIVFYRAGSAQVLLESMASAMFCSDGLSKMKSEGLKAAGYQCYKKVCRLGLWDANLSDSLENVMSDPAGGISTFSEKDASEVSWTSEYAIDLSDL
ncbi:poly(A)-specific ribonuclease PARN-like isoform X1 [Zingiber officinale]|uniref:poly(A)-specific ribonuclease PARN-like isoform X1 n=1 Tax=Zingiber officinale TaxID=94328 RepID=UPI001C4B0C2E|nr:poly(A)-specific ribonuclease PARN-like isoform X1 [Zingiber officinale]